MEADLHWVCSSVSNITINLSEDFPQFYAKHTVQLHRDDSENFCCISRPKHVHNSRQSFPPVCRKLYRLTLCAEAALDNTPYLTFRPQAKEPEIFYSIAAQRYKSR